eukprot:2443568-Amphidinium_carterae.1
MRDNMNETCPSVGWVGCCLWFSLRGWPPWPFWIEGWWNPSLVILCPVAWPCAARRWGVRRG